MAESYVQVTEGDAGKKLHTFTRTKSGNEVHDEVVILGEPHLPSYTVIAGAISLASGAVPPLQLMAGSSKRILIRRIRAELRSAAAAGMVEIRVRRASAAGSGGSAQTPAPFDPADPAAASTAMVSPTSVPTGSTYVMRFALHATAAAPQDAVQSYEWVQLPNQKPIVIPAGTSNGIYFEVAAGVTSGSGNISIDFDEETE